jgi:hypothetical protein
MKLPEQNSSIPALIDAAHQKRGERPRHHLGASMLGNPCDRALWLSFRWAVIEQFPGRILRLFRRGHNEESTIMNDLRLIGVNFKNLKGQERVDFGSHVSGSLDGIALSGVPEAPTKAHVCEFKTHSKKSFDDLDKNGVEKSKPLHYVQMQVYMHGTKIDRALYVAVCKDDDKIYTDRVRYVKEVAEKYINRGKRITLSERMPEPISTDSTWYQCKFCPSHKFCHEEKLTQEVNCRTCAHSTPMPDSTWTCAKWEEEIPPEAQYKGCEYHVLHPDMVPWEIVDSDSSEYAVYIIDGKPVKNGKKDHRIFSSEELIANAFACANPDEFMDDVRADGGKVVKWSGDYDIA